MLRLNPFGMVGLVSVPRKLPTLMKTRTNVQNVHMEESGVPTMESVNARRKIRISTAIPIFANVLEAESSTQRQLRVTVLSEGNGTLSTKNASAHGLI